VAPGGTLTLGGCGVGAFSSRARLVDRAFVNGQCVVSTVVIEEDAGANDTIRLFRALIDTAAVLDSFSIHVAVLATSRLCTLMFETAFRQQSAVRVRHFAILGSVPLPRPLVIALSQPVLDSLTLGSWRWTHQPAPWSTGGHDDDDDGVVAAPYAESVSSVTLTEEMSVLLSLSAHVFKGGAPVCLWLRRFVNTLTTVNLSIGASSGVELRDAMCTDVLPDFITAAPNLVRLSVVCDDDGLLWPPLPTSSGLAMLTAAHGAVRRRLLSVLTLSGGWLCDDTPGLVDALARIVGREEDNSRLLHGGLTLTRTRLTMRALQHVLAAAAGTHVPLHVDRCDGGDCESVAARVAESVSALGANLTHVTLPSGAGMSAAHYERFMLAAATNDRITSISGVLVDLSESTMLALCTLLETTSSVNTLRVTFVTPRQHATRGSSSSSSSKNPTEEEATAAATVATRTAVTRLAAVRMWPAFAKNQSVRTLHLLASPAIASSPGSAARGTDDEMSRSFARGLETVLRTNRVLRHLDTSVSVDRRLSHHIVDALRENNTLRTLAFGWTTMGVYDTFLTAAHRHDLYVDAVDAPSVERTKRAALSSLLLVSHATRRAIASLMCSARALMQANDVETTVSATGPDAKRARRSTTAATASAMARTTQIQVAYAQSRVFLNLDLLVHVMTVVASSSSSSSSSPPTVTPLHARRAVLWAAHRRPMWRPSEVDFFTYVFHGVEPTYN